MPSFCIIPQSYEGRIRKAPCRWISMSAISYVYIFGVTPTVAFLSCATPCDFNSVIVFLTMLVSKYFLLD